MPIVITAEEEILVGDEVVIEGAAPDGHFVTVFEDDGDTGYFYALNMLAQDNQIQDALHIYNVANVTDRAKPSVIKIGWSKDSQKAVLLINNYPHAVFDFSTCRGFCRTGFPPTWPDRVWSSTGHQWDDGFNDLFE
jgi:hypothetical protein